ncbi:DUF1932 domain-containing protein [Sphingopyxis sp. 22461]|uniref:NAD(P)-dependent oxidoreductase n=1 Tax=Sphingopyxis sp. 22461 TaxID=3453923 RepID=UPI003F8586DF
MTQDVGLIGFGEAAGSFARAGWRAVAAAAYDRKVDDPATREAKLADIGAAGLRVAKSAADAVMGADTILSLVTADQTVAAAAASAPHLGSAALYCDGNSVAPDTKRAAARIVEESGGHYVDMAIMAPVEPARLAVPILLSGRAARRAARQLGTLGFSNVQVVGEVVGRASSIKMIRSVIVKGMEALTAECVCAAEEAGVLDEVLASLDASEQSLPWAGRAAYNLDRMLVHGVRRAAEMDEVVRTLDALGTGSVMTRGTAVRQREIGALGVNSPPDGLSARIAATRPSKSEAA